jgi:hypothetical protein
MCRANGRRSRLRPESLLAKRLRPEQLEIERLRPCGMAMSSTGRVVDRLQRIMVRCHSPRTDGRRWAKGCEASRGNADSPLPPASNHFALAGFTGLQ